MISLTLTCTCSPVSFEKRASYAILSAAKQDISTSPAGVQDFIGITAKVFKAESEFRDRSVCVCQRKALVNWRESKGTHRLCFFIYFIR